MWDPLAVLGFQKFYVGLEEILRAFQQHNVTWVEVCLLISNSSQILPAVKIKTSNKHTAYNYYKIQIFFILFSLSTNQYLQFDISQINFVLALFPQKKNWSLRRRVHFHYMAGTSKILSKMHRNLLSSCRTLKSPLAHKRFHKTEVIWCHRVES